MLPLEELVQHINSAHRLALTPGARYATGEQGAYALLGAQGRAYVLKWQPGTDQLERIFYAQAVTERLRAQGYPAPAYLYIGGALGGIYTVVSTVAQIWRQNWTRAVSAAPWPYRLPGMLHHSSR